jgi:hypothetical protein
MDKKIKAYRRNKRHAELSGTNAETIKEVLTLRRTKIHPKFGIFELHFIYES